MAGEFGALSVDRRDLSRVASGASSSSAEPQDPSAGAWEEGLEPWGMTDWRLPGQGESGPKCGEWYPASVCNSCGHLDLGTHKCGRRSCPDCWGVWAKEAAVRAAHRIQSFRYVQPDDWRRQAAHGYVSPPEGEVRTEEDFWRWRSEAAEIAESKGWRGFAVIGHPYRVTGEGKERYRAEDPEYGIWVWLRNDVEDMSRYTYWSPHYHIVGMAGRDMDPAEDSDPFMYQFKRSLTRFDGVHDTGSHEDAYGLFRYLLSHTGYPEGSSKQSVVWYGQLANSVFVDDAKQEWQIQKPSEGVRSVLRRELEAVAGVQVEEEGEGGEGDEAGECPEGECDGFLIDVFDVGAYLRSEDPEPEVRRRMEAARDWRLGRVEPPPGMKHPRTEEEAREAFGEML